MISIALAAAMLTPAPTATAAYAVMLQRIPILGGYSAADVNNAEVQAAANYAAEQLGSELKEIESAKRQSVAGTNYELVIWTQDGSRYRVVVYRPLRGDMQLSSQEQLEVADIGPATAGDDE